MLPVLVREIPDGYVSPQLKQVQEGDYVCVRGPRGRFTFNETGLEEKNFYFIATGTGIAPFHCFTGSYPQLNYRLLHGVRYPEERYEHTTYPKDRYTACLSQDNSGDPQDEPGAHFQGRVTEYLAAYPPDPTGLFYLCGNANMIYDVFALLKHQGIPRDRVFTEVYF